MKSMGEALREVARRVEERQAARAAGREVDSEDEAAGTEPVCALCAGVGFVRTTSDPALPDFGVPTSCECLYDRPLEERVAQVLPPSLRAPSAPLGSLEAPLRRWIGLDAAERPDIVIAGPSGNGKTYAAAWVAREAMAADVTLRPAWVDVVQLLDSLRSAIGSDDKTRAERVLSALEVPPLLVLDDLGAERPTEWTTERLLTLINRRVRADQSRTIITTNLESPADVEALMGQRVADRMAGMAWLHTGGKSQRLAQGIAATEALTGALPWFAR